jgi:hypothetical protein
LTNIHQNQRRTKRKKKKKTQGTRFHKPPTLSTENKTKEKKKRKQHKSHRTLPLLTPRASLLPIGRPCPPTEQNPTHEKKENNPPLHKSRGNAETNKQTKTLVAPKTRPPLSAKKKSK